MQQTLGPALAAGMANKEGARLHRLESREGTEVWEETGETLFRAGEYVAPGAYIEIETGRCMTLISPDFLPARLDGHVACYRLARRSWGERVEMSLAQR